MSEYIRRDDSMLEDHIEMEEQRLTGIEGRLESLEIVVNELKDIMVQAKGAVSFIKIVAGLIAMAAAAYTYVSNTFSITIK